jgi:hypothetical protein
MLRLLDVHQSALPKNAYDDCTVSMQASQKF